MSEFGTLDSNHADGAALPDAKLIEHLKACQRIAVEQAEEYFSAFFQRLLAQLLEFIDDSKSNQEQARLLEAHRELNKKHEKLVRFFCGYLGEGYIKFKNGELNTCTGEEKYSSDMLSLVDNDDLEETIAISSIARRSENRHPELIWSLNKRFSMLNHGHKVDEASNPISPVQFCESLRKSLRLLNIDTKVKIIAYRCFDKSFMAEYDSILEATNCYLLEASILPHLRYNPGDSAVRPVVDKVVDALAGTAAGSMGESVAASVAAESAQQSTTGQGLMPLPPAGGATEHYQNNLLDAIRVLQSHIGVAPVTGADAGAAQPPLPAVSSEVAVQVGGSASSAPAVYSGQQFMGVLQSLQQQVLAGTEVLQEQSVAPLEAQNITVASSQFGAQLQAEAQKEGASVDPDDLHTIDLVGMLFEYMLSDDNLPSSVKALLSYLHTPFLKVAFLDKSFFEESEHPARLLLNRLAETGAQWVSDDGTSQYDIYLKIKTIVSRVLDEFKSDVALFAELLQEFNSYVKRVSRRQELVEKRAMEKAQGEEKLREVKVRVNQEVRQRTDDRALPSAVLLLLLQPWSDYLAFLLLRYGDAADSWQRALAAMDDLLWTIEPKELAADKARQMEMHDALLDILETGFETIGYDQSKSKKLLEALFALQKLALQSKQAEPAPKPMRVKLETMAAERAGRSEEQQPMTEEEGRMVEHLKMIEFGTWFEFSGGKRLKVAWYNSKTLHYMLVDQMGKKVAMKSGLALAREMIQGQAKVIAGSTKPFFERALENIFHSLNEKAEAVQLGGSDA